MATVLVTGASRGIGLGLVRQYAAAGWSVLATCRNPAGAHALRGVKGDVTVEMLDVEDRPSIEGLAKKLAGTTVDVLVNNAGIDARRREYRPASGTHRLEINTPEWEKVIRVNLIGPYLVTTAFLPHLQRSAEKLAIYLSSRMGSISLNKEGGFYEYRTSKAALNMLVAGLSVDPHYHGITFVAFHPGRVKTDLGGEDAMLTVEESASRLISAICHLSPENNGSFLDLSKSSLPW